MNRLKTFYFETQNIRVIDQDNGPWFVAKDVCDVLEIKNTSDALKRLDVDERARFNLGRQGETNIINEYGLYSLVLASRKPEAKQFKRWVTHEVIPSIRKHGAYMTPDTLEQAIANPDFTIGLLTSLKEERLKREAFEALIEHQKPKVLFADAVQASHTSILVGDLAKLLKQNGIDVGQKRLFEWLRENGYLVKRKGSDYNSPTQKSMELGLFEIKETPVHHNSGSISISKTSKVTGKGQVYFINKFLGKVVAI